MCDKKTSPESGFIIIIIISFMIMIHQVITVWRTVRAMLGQSLK